MNFFPTNHPQRYIIIFREKTLKKYEKVLTYHVDFEVVEIENED
jgi:hypothetical protein